jgi:hypothetical protein
MLQLLRAGMGQTRRFGLLERRDYSKSRRRWSPFLAYDNDDLRKLREDQRDKISITALAAKRVYTTADIELIWTGTGEVNRRASAIGGTAVVESRRPLPLPPDVDPHGNFDGVIESRSEIPHRTLDL